jgi:uncharacterized protein
VIVVDTGPIVAAAITDDAHHEQCVQEFARLFKARTTMVVPSFVAAEACYMLSRFGTPQHEAALVRSLESGLLTFGELTPGDLGRVAVLVDRYADFPLGAADASVVAVAERLKATEVFTPDVRHFSVLRPAHTSAFTLLPE